MISNTFSAQTISYFLCDLFLKESELHVTSQKLTVLEQSHQSLQKQISDAHAALALEEEKSAMLQSQLVVLLEEKTARTEDMAKLQAEKARMDSSIEELEGTLKERKAAVYELQRTVTQSEHQVKERQTEIDNMKVLD